MDPSSPKQPQGSTPESSRLRLDVFDLAESADSGDCLWCALIYRSLIGLGAELPEPGTIGTAAIVARQGKPFYVEWATMQERIAAEIYQPVGGEATIPELGEASDLGPDIESKEVFEKIRGWIKRCDEGHDLCKIDSVPLHNDRKQKRLSTIRRFMKASSSSKQEQSQTPRRLLDVGDPSLPADQRTIRLVQDVKENFKYMCLSHCWGDYQGFTTTKRTLRKRLKEIHWDDLPRTYQDSITVARMLGLRFLWIDSLCIVQDDSLDWSLESVKMGGIYEQSYITLAAALASGDDIGFLQTSAERHSYISHQVDLSDFGKGDQARVRRIHDYRTITTPHLLDGRAWTLQEALLPPRLLTFSVAVFFECRQGNSCECGSGLLPDPFAAEPKVFRKPDRAAYAKFIRKELDSFELYEYWTSNIVQEYSLRKLTKQNDRILALHAMTSKFKLVSGDTYLAGLWKNELAYTLAWHTPSRYDPTPQIAPSWSWASVDGSIGYAFDLDKGEYFRKQVKFVHAEVDVSPTGELRRGELHIQAFICWGQLEIDWVLSENSYHLKYAIKYENQAYGQVSSINDPESGSLVFLDSFVTQTEEINYMTRRSLPHLHRSSRRDTPHINSSTRVCCALLGHLYGQEETRYFLILATDPRKAGVYYRLGLIQVEKTLDEDLSPWFGEMDQQVIIIK